MIKGKNELEILTMIEFMEKLDKFIDNFAKEKKEQFKENEKFALADSLEVGLFQAFTKFVLGNPDPTDLKEKICLYAGLLQSLGNMTSGMKSLSEIFQNAINETAKKFTEKGNTELN